MSAFNMLPAKHGESKRAVAQGRTLVVKNLGKGQFFALVEGERQGRFGNSEQISQDISHFTDSGTLPKSATNWY